MTRVVYYSVYCKQSDQDLPIPNSLRITILTILSHRLWRLVKNTAIHHHIAQHDWQVVQETNAG